MTQIDHHTIAVGNALVQVVICARKIWGSRKFQNWIELIGDSQSSATSGSTNSWDSSLEYGCSIFTPYHRWSCPTLCSAFLQDKPALMANLGNLNCTLFLKVNNATDPQATLSSFDQNIHLREVDETGVGRPLARRWLIDDSVRRGWHEGEKAECEQLTNAGDTLTAGRYVTADLRLYVIHQLNNLFFSFSWAFEENSCD